MHSLNFSNFEPNKYGVSGGLCGTTIVNSSVPDLWYGGKNNELIPENVCKNCDASTSFAQYWK